MNAFIKYILVLPLASLLLISTPLLSMEATRSSTPPEKAHFETFGKTALDPAVSHAIIEAISRMWLSFQPSPTNHNKAELMLIEHNSTFILNSLAEKALYHPESITLAFLWTEFIEKPLLKDHKYSAIDINNALKKWVSGYRNEYAIVPSFSQKLQDEGIHTSEADQVALWLLNYQIDKTFPLS